MTRPRVVVIGAGVIGIAIAKALALRGAAQVLVVESSRDGRGLTTSRSGGGVRGLLADVELRRLSRHSRRLRGLDSPAPTEIALRRTGYLILAESTEQRRRLEAAVDDGYDNGEQSRWLTVDQIPAVVGREIALTGVQCAAWAPRDGWVDPNAWVDFDRRVAASLGVVVRHPVLVTRILVRSGRVAGIDTSGGAIDAEIVVYAGGSHGLELLEQAGLGLPVTIETHHVLVLDGNAADTSLPTIIWGDSFGIRSRGNVLHLGTTLQSSINANDPAMAYDSVRTLNEARERLPELRSRDVAGEFSCSYEETTDHRPLVGPFQEVTGLFCAVGFGGHGFMMAPAVAEMLADQICGGQSGGSLPFNPARYGL